MKKLLLALLILPLFVEAQIISTIAGNGIPGYIGDGGPAVSEEMNQPCGFNLDAAGNMYIADYNNHRIRKINTSGIITTIAGIGTPGYSGDGLQATAAAINLPLYVVADRSGNIYFSDSRNYRIRKINSSGIISTIAGNGSPGFGGDLGPATAAMLNIPYGLVLDGRGNLYIADQINNRVRMVNTSGIISTVAGTGAPAFTGDGVAAVATALNQPNYLCLDTAGNLVITDNGNQRIRKVNADGIITTIAGDGTLGSLGDGSQATAAQLGWPGGIKFDAAGNLYIADAYNYKIRKVSTSGIITTIAGTGMAGYSGDGGPAISAQLNVPIDIGFDAIGNLIVDDDVNNRIREIGVCINTITTQPVNDTVFSGANAIYSVTATMASPMYQWQEDPGSGFVNLADVVPYSGVTTNTLAISNVNLLFNTTHYRCVISNGISCTDTSAGAILILKDNTGVNNINAPAEIVIFPNPATTTLTIQTTYQLINQSTSPSPAVALAKAGTINHITVTNLIGQTVYIQNYNTDEIQIDISSLPAGMYFVKVNGNEVRKFAKE